MSAIDSTAMSNAGPADSRLGAYDYGLFVAVVLSWSASWYAIELQVGIVPVQTSLFWRFAIAAAVMFVWVIAAKKPLRFPLALHAVFAALGLLLFCLNFMLFYYGSAYLVSGLLSVVFSLASVFNLAFAFVLSRRIPRARVLGGAFTGLAGISLMFWPEIEGQPLTGTGIIGLALCIGGTLSFCTGNQVSAALQVRKVPVLSASALGMAYGAALSGLLTISLGHSLAIEMSVSYVGSLLFLAIVSSVVAFWAYLTLLGRIGAGRAGYATVVFPVIALLISAWLEGYVFAPVAFAGLAMVLAGNVLVLGGGKRA